jgi:radical SAM superfamily enzyme YgiQ (UPF0313 family)
MEPGITSVLVNPFDSATVPQEHGHLGLEYIASYQETKKQTSEIIDANFLGWGPDIVAEEVKKRNPDVVGFTLFEHGLDMNCRLAERIKKESTKNRIHITAGGLYPSLHAETLLKKYPALDSIVLYDGEETFTTLVESIKKNHPLSSVKGIIYREGNSIKKNPLRRPILDLNALPYPKRVILPDQDALAIMASRGCYARCKFCSTNAFNANMGAPKIRFRSVDSVLKELVYLYEKYRIKRYWFNDANFCAPDKLQPGWVESLAQGIIEHRLQLRFYILCRADDIDHKRFALLKKAGLERLSIGFESIHPRVLNYLQKDISVETNQLAINILRTLGIQMLAGYIMFDPYSTLDEISKSIDFVSRFHRQYPYYRTVTRRNRLIVYENTEMFESCEKDGLLADNPYRYDFAKAEVEDLWRMISIWHSYSHNLHRYGRMAELCHRLGLSDYPKLLFKLCLEYLRIDEAFFRSCLRLAARGVKAQSNKFKRETEVFRIQITGINDRLRKLTDLLRHRHGIYVWAQEEYQRNKLKVNI